MKARLFVLMVWITGFGASFASNRSGDDCQPRPLTIQEAVRMALAHSPEVLLAKAQSLRAGHAVGEIRSLNLPQITTGTGLAYNNGFPMSIEGSAPSIFEVNATQSIFSKTNKNLMREAEETSKASELGDASVRNNIASRTALLYYALHQARRIISLTSERLELARRQQSHVENLLAAGKARNLDATVAKAAVRSLEHALLGAREQERIAEAELKETTGLSESETVVTADPHVDTPVFSMQEDDLFRQALESSPEVRQAEALARAKEFRIEAAKGENYPQINLVSRYSLFSRVNKYEDFFRNFVRNNFVIGVSLQIPVFNGFRTKERVAQSREEALEARYRLQSLQSDLKKNLRRAHSDLRIAQDAVELAQIEVSAAQETLQVNEALLHSGRISAKQFEEFVSARRQKELAQLEADGDLFQRKITLLRTMGLAASTF